MPNAMFRANAEADKTRRDAVRPWQGVDHDDARGWSFLSNTGIHDLARAKRAQRRKLLISDTLPSR